VLLLQYTRQAAAVWRCRGQHGQSLRVCVKLVVVDGWTGGGVLVGGCMSASLGGGSSLVP
jgi:hypothetical protein